jgi:hypothetical protein
MTTKTNPTVAAPKRMCKWSGDEEPQSYYSREDEDTATLTVGEQRRIQGYHANAQRNWRNADEDNDRRVVAAAQAIVRSIRRESETETAAPRRVSSAVWTTPWDEPLFESEYPDYEEHEESTHMPFMNLTKEERDKKRIRVQRVPRLLPETGSAVCMRRLQLKTRRPKTEGRNRRHDRRGSPSIMCRRGK